MPRELIATAPRQAILREYDDLPLGPTEVRIRTEFASPKHGTELVGYRDEPAARRAYDPRLGMMAAGENRFPKRLGNMAVGMVMEIGADVTRFKPGDRVFGHFPIRETQAVDETRADLLPPELSAEAAVCLDPAVMAFALRDAGIALGDRVAVFGLGAIGLFAVQLARLAGAHRVIGVDFIAHRRQVACSLGADAVVDPAEDDPGLAIRRLTGEGPSAWQAAAEPRRILGGYTETPSQTGQLGVDVAVEVSGSTRALHDAIRATRFGGTVCVLSFYGGAAEGLHLGEEFHINQLTLISARAESLPMRDAPDWDLKRMTETTLAWLVEGRLRTDGIVFPIVPFDDAVAAYREIDEHPERSIKLGISFG